MAAPTVSANTTARSVETRRLTLVLAVATVALLPVAEGWILWSAPGSSADRNQWVSASPFDLPLILLVAVQIATLIEDRRSSATSARAARVPLLLLAAALLWMLVCTAVHPSWRALDFALHVAGAWALARTARHGTRPEQDLLLASLTGLGVFQALLGIAQSRVGDVVGLGLFEIDGYFYTFGGTAAGRGSLTHPYHLTALLIVCAAAAALLAARTMGPRRVAVLVALTVIGASIPLTFSRAIVLAVVPMLALWVWRPRTRAAAAAFLVGLAVGVALGLGGASSKAAQTTDVDAVDSGRRDRVEEALNLVEEEPVFGVGPGRYVIALRDVEHVRLLPPHNIAVQAAAEAGILGGLLVTATVVAFGLWLLRQSAMVVAAGIALVPLHLLDSYPHVFPAGITISGLWLATIAICLTAEDEPAPAEART